MQFRKLRADEVEVRVGTVKKDGSGMSLLLYKDARCDMNILDETVGAFNWMRDHKELKGNIYCGVSIKSDDEWVTKWDCGSESNTEAEKGEASDSFKRACFNWGIGRELYTSPFIWVKGYDKYEKFKVGSIDYEGNKICALSILDSKGNVAYQMGSRRTKPVGTVAKRISEEQVEELNALITATKTDSAAFCKFYKCESVESLRASDYDSAIAQLNKKLNKMVGVNLDESDLPEAMRG